MWAYHEIFYQIYPMGFCAAPIHNDGKTVSRIRRLDGWSEYLQDLGIGSNKAHLPLAYGILFGMPGIPCIYYGSEWAEEGVKAPDNDYALRPAFDAPRPNELTDFIRALITMRRKSDALCSGGYRNVVVTNQQLIFERKTENEKIFVAINASESKYTAYSEELRGNCTELITKSSRGDFFLPSHTTYPDFFIIPKYLVQSHIYKESVSKSRDNYCLTLGSRAASKVLHHLPI